MRNINHKITDDVFDYITHNMFEETKSKVTQRLIENVNLINMPIWDQIRQEILSKVNSGLHETTSTR